ERGQGFAGTPEAIGRSGLIGSFLEHLSVLPTAGTQLVNVTFEASDAGVAMNVVNTLATTYIDEQLASQSADSSKLMGWINDRLGEQQRRLAQSESALQAYMEHHDAVSVQD